MEVGPVPEQDLAEILKYLETHNLGVNNFRTKVGKGVSQCFGIVGKRCTAPGLSRQSWLHPKLHKLLEEFGEKHVKQHTLYSSIQVNCNYPCNPHRDANNLGNSYIIGFGNYAGGELCVEEVDKNINYRGLLFDGSQNTHSTKPWIGNRYSLVYHTLAPKERWGTIESLTNYEVVEHEGITKIRKKSDGTLLWKGHGLIHPLSGKRVSASKGKPRPPPI